MMEGISDALIERVRTKMVRILQNAGRYGETWRTDTCIGVRFEWLAYLGDLRFLEILWRDFVIYLARRERRSMDWKSSSFRP